MRIAIIATYVHPSRRPLRPRSVLYTAVPELIAALCPKHAELEVFNEKGQPIPLDRHWDLVFFSYLHPYYEHTKVLSTLFRRRGITTVAGGRHAGFYAKDCLQYFDAVIVGEPESNVPQLIDDFEKGRLGRIYANPPVEPAAIPALRYDLLDFRVIGDRLPAIEASRGCPFHCNFCVLPAGGEQYRYRPVRHVLGEIESKMRWNPNYGGFARNGFIFLDNNLGGSPRYLRELCEGLVPLKKRWGCTLTFNILRDPELVRVMAKAGCRNIYTGLESLNPESLQSMNKGQNRIGELAEVAKRTFESGILLTFGILIGADGDTPEYMERIPEYLSELRLRSVTLIGFVCPFPGTPFFTALEQQGRLLPDTSIRDYDGMTLCHQPRDASVSETVEHYQRLCRGLSSGTSIARHYWEHLWQSDLPGYKTAILGSGQEIRSLRQYLNNDRRTYVGGQDPLEAWDREQMAELGLAPQVIT